ncbi:MAG: cache domain-containing protein [Chloroflexi bacterium]|nr:cache domain-containing protein [Chloroflexota bacterium]
MKDFFRPLQRRHGMTMPITVKVILSLLLVIAIISVVFMVFGVRIISDRIVAEAQEKVRNDLNTGREIYLSKLAHIDTVVHLTADRFFLMDAYFSGNSEQVTAELTRVKEDEGLDVLTLTDQHGNVLLRTSNPGVIGDNQSHDPLVAMVIQKMKSLSSTTLVSENDLMMESPILAEQAYFKFIDTPHARYRAETEQTAGMMLKAASPVFDSQHHLVGVLYGGILLNRNHEVVDKIKQTVYHDVEYEGKDIGTATIFEDDVRISTNVPNEDGSRATGTRIAEDVYNQVFIQGKQWIGRAYVVNDWYITAYEPIKDINDKVIGILYVGVLEKKYIDIRQQTVYTFLTITLLGVLITLAVSYLISLQILIPIRKLVSTSRALAEGNLDARVDIRSGDEMEYLASSFNAMARALKKRDEQLKEFATKKIMESEKLAIVGQLAANVAHELNNPLTGIVTYSHLLLEKGPCDDSTRISMEKIAGQADRCKEIIRGLLDFSRQREPEKTLGNINAIMRGCISLMENQAAFHNIEIVENYQDNLPLVVIDHSQIERVFMNLIINAAEAMNDGGKLTLATRLDPDDRVVEVEFTDTGHGISEENMNKLFEPFFTTKDIGHGTGLGLAISYGIIKSHKGVISVESEVGKGTTFVVRLPLNGIMEEPENEPEIEIAHH